eukprot:2623467-Rhodomonas_salina.2
MNAKVRRSKASDARYRDVWRGVPGGGVLLPVEGQEQGCHRPGATTSSSSTTSFANASSRSELSLQAAGASRA